MLDYSLARETMVDSQLRTAGITDRRILAAMSTLPRERFVAAANRPLAYMDGAVPVTEEGSGAGRRYLMSPMVLARLIQLAELTEDETCLVIGCATGYSVAVLAALARSVTGLECDPALAGQARENLAGLGIRNASIEIGELAAGPAAEGLYNLILLDGSVAAVPAALERWMVEGGRMLAIISRGAQGTAHLLTKTDGEVSALPQFAAGAKPLPGFAALPSFSF